MYLRTLGFLLGILLIALPVVTLSFNVQRGALVIAHPRAGQDRTEEISLTGKEMATRSKFRFLSGFISMAMGVILCVVVCIPPAKWAHLRSVLMCLFLTLLLANAVISIVFGFT